MHNVEFLLIFIYDSDFKASLYQKCWHRNDVINNWARDEVGVGGGGGRTMGTTHQPQEQRSLENEFPY